MASQNSTKKPNILDIWGDDIGIANLSCYSHGLMGYQTTNIDRLAKEGMKCTDAYAEQSCTAGRASFFRSEKNTNWEGAFRIPLIIRWPGKIPAGSVSNEIVHHHDWLPTFLAMAGDPDIVEELLKGHQAAGKKFKVHIDGYNLLPYLTGKEKKNPRQGFIYFDDDGNLVALRYDNWKVVFMVTIDQALEKMNAAASGAGH